MGNWLKSYWVKSVLHPKYDFKMSELYKIAEFFVVINNLVVMRVQTLLRLVLPTHTYHTRDLLISLD